MSYKTPVYPVTAEVTEPNNDYAFEFEVRVNNQPVAIIMARGIDFNGARITARESITLVQAEKLLPVVRLND